MCTAKGEKKNFFCVNAKSTGKCRFNAGTNLGNHFKTQENLTNHI